MHFCTNCGKELADGIKFCHECGKAVNDISATDQRKTVYDGEIHKCPECGEIINSFVLNCPACGLELRGINSSSSINQFVAKLEEIESKREHSKSNPWRELYFGKKLSKTDEQKISLIRSFAIPNTKEDLFEFLILSVSNIDYSAYENENSLRVDARREVSEAWRSKFEQAYQKAKMMFPSDPQFAEIEQMHKSTNNSIKKAKNKQWRLAAIIWGSLITFFLIIFIVGCSISAITDSKETKRLEGIEDQIECALDNKNFKYALALAEQLVYGGTNDNLVRDWVIKKDYWIDKTIQTAFENGIALERTSYSTEDSAKLLETEYDYNNFVVGYEKAEFEKYNSPASENGLGGKEIFIVGVLEKTELLETDGTYIILGYIADEVNNTWLIKMHVVPIVSETYFESAIGQKVVCKVIYDGYSEVKQMPSTTLDELMILNSGAIIYGLQKIMQ